MSEKDVVIELGSKPVWMDLDADTRVMPVSGVGVVLETARGQLMVPGVCVAEYVTVEKPAIVSAHGRDRVVIRHRELVAVEAMPASVGPTNPGSVVTFQIKGDGQ